MSAGAEFSSDRSRVGSKSRSRPSMGIDPRRRRDRTQTRMTRSLLLIASLIFSGASCAAQYSEFDTDVAALAQEYGAAKSEKLSSDQQADAFEALRVHAEIVSKRYDSRAEPLVWQAWALCGYAMAIKSFGSLGAYRKARDKFNEALAIDPKVFNGKPWITLARLYHYLPPFPISYGSKRKAREYYRKGLSLDPSDCEGNYYWAVLLADDEEYEAAMRHLETAAKTQQQKPEELAYKSKIEGLQAEIKAKMASK
jgi:tetratricopeptide (TPR) repeat protein